MEPTGESDDEWDADDGDEWEDQDTLGSPPPPTPLVEQNTSRGRWLKHRRWEKTDEEKERIIKIKSLARNENERRRTEKAFLRERLEQYRDHLEQLVDHEEFAKYFTKHAVLLAQYFAVLPRMHGNLQDITEYLHWLETLRTWNAATPAELDGAMAPLLSSLAHHPHEAIFQRKHQVAHYEAYRAKNKTSSYEEILQRYTRDIESEQLADEDSCEQASIAAASAASRFDVVVSAKRNPESTFIKGHRAAFLGGVATKTPPPATAATIDPTIYVTSNAVIKMRKTMRNIAVSKVKSVSLTADQISQEDAKIAAFCAGQYINLFHYSQHCHLFLTSALPIVYSVFSQFELNESSLEITPLRLQDILKRLTVVMGSSQELQTIVDATLNLRTEKISFIEFFVYFHQHCAELIARHSLAHRYYLSELSFYPSTTLTEVREIFVNYHLQCYRMRLLREYRSQAANQPSFPCRHCGRAFLTELQCQKHIESRHDNKFHRDYHLRLLLLHCQHHFLSYGCHLATKFSLPGYFELLPYLSSPKFYVPQIFDSPVSTEHRRKKIIGVLQYNRLIYVEECLGDYLRVKFVDINHTVRSGWICTFCKPTSFQSTLVLFPAIVTKLSAHHTANFPWHNARFFTRSISAVYYQVRCDLPAQAEIKVRNVPLDLDNNEILGYLRPGDIVRCYAMVGNWLHVRYHGEYTAWVNVEAGGGDATLPYNDKPFRRRYVNYTVCQVERPEKALLQLLHPSVCAALAKTVGEASPVRDIDKALLEVNERYTIAENTYDLLDSCLEQLTCYPYEL